jgi:hypothetical protein
MPTGHYWLRISYCTLFTRETTMILDVLENANRYTELSALNADTKGMACLVHDE